jgi:Spy/CpxP family protein refolding chaperone
MGMGPGVHGYADGYGPGYRDGYSPRGRGYRSDTALSKEQIEKLEAAREKFYDETKALRNKIRDKRIALNDAMDTDKPDGKKVAELQKELSQLRSEFDEKAVQHQLEVQALVPDDARGRGFGRSGRSFGTGYGGYCWR